MNIFASPWASLGPAGPGTSKRDYTYISDIIDGILASIHLNCSFEIINLGNSHTTTLAKLIRMIEDKIGKSAHIKELPNQPGDVPITCANISKANRLLNYNPKIDLETGITNFIQWFKETNT